MTCQEEVLYAGNTLKRIYTFTDNSTAYDPSTITINIVDSEGNVIKTVNKDEAELTRASEGTYQLSYNLPETVTKGLWWIIVNATYTSTNLNKTKVFSFNVDTTPA